MKRPWLIALAGNPNVGKSTVFNSLTGLHQHTGNWPGKTVASAQGEYAFRGEKYRLIDLPGAYSLAAHSAAPFFARPVRGPAAPPVAQLPTQLPHPVRSTWPTQRWRALPQTLATGTAC